jgi:hypothetical protein
MNHNYARPNFSKKGKTPIQILLEDWPEISPTVLHFPVYDLDALFRQKMESPKRIQKRGQYVPKLPGFSHFYTCTLLGNSLPSLDKNAKFVCRNCWTAKCRQIHSI